MGRRSVALADERRWVFNRLAGDYLARPPYPAVLVERLAALAGPGRRVVDLGAGTGHLAVPLAVRGLQVTAVEPARAMLAALRPRPAEMPPGAGLRLVHATAEATGLPDGAFDLVLLADALHWVDPERAGREAARLLAEGGTAAVVEAAFAPTPFMDGLSALLARENPKARRRPPGRVRHFLALATGGAVGEEVLRQDVPLDDACLESLLRSLSYAGPALAPQALDRLVAEARAVGRAAGGARLSRQLTLRWSARPRRRRA
jgi:SAM-dependent methyltransferase